MTKLLRIDAELLGNKFFVQVADFSGDSAPSEYTLEYEVSVSVAGHSWSREHYEMPSVDELIAS